MELMLGIDNEETINNEIYVGNESILNINIKDLSKLCSACITDKLLICGLTDGTICIIDIKTNKCLKTLTGHTTKVTSIGIYKNLIISQSKDKIIRMWDIYNNVKCVNIIENNVSNYRIKSNNSIFIDNYTEYRGGLLFLGTQIESSIFVMDMWLTIIDNIMNNNVGFGHVIHICRKNNLIVSASLDRTIRIWDVNYVNYCECLVMISVDYNVVSLHIHNNLLIAGLGDGSIFIWDIYTYMKINVLYQHKFKVLFICARGDILITASQTEIYMWDIKSWECLKLLNFSTLHLFSEPSLVKIQTLSISDANIIYVGCTGTNIIYTIPITLLPSEYNIFKTIILHYSFPRYLVYEIMGYLINKSKFSYN